jgi:hypothetical protein
MAYNVQDRAGNAVSLKTVADSSGNLAGSAVITDAGGNNQAAVASVIGAANAAPGSGYQLQVGALDLLTHAAGNWDAKREAGADTLPMKGIAPALALVGTRYTATSTSSVSSGSTSATLSVAATSGFVVGGWCNLEPGTTRYESAVITAVVAITSVTVAFPSGGALYTHTASYTIETFSPSIGREAPGRQGALLVNSKGTKPTFRYSVTGATPVATPTDFLVIQGSSSQTIRVKYLKVGGLATTAGQLVAQLIRRSTAGTAGSATLTAISPMKHDINDAAATATVSYVQTANYTTLGTLAGQGGVKRMYLNTAAGGPPTEAIWDKAKGQDKPLILRGHQRLPLGQLQWCHPTGRHRDRHRDRDRGRQQLIAGCRSRVDEAARFAGA